MFLTWIGFDQGGSFLAACASQAQALKASPVWATEEIWIQLEKARDLQGAKRGNEFVVVHNTLITFVDFSWKFQGMLNRLQVLMMKQSGNNFLGKSLQS